MTLFILQQLNEPHCSLLMMQYPQGKIIDFSRNTKMEGLELTSVQSDAFIATLRNPGITASELKELLKLSQSTVAGIIARLESKGLIEKSVDEADARKAIPIPTNQGKSLEEPLKEIAIGTQQCLVDGMSLEEQEEFSRLLQIALNNMKRI